MLFPFCVSASGLESENSHAGLKVNIIVRKLKSKFSFTLNASAYFNSFIQILKVHINPNVMMSVTFSNNYLEVQLCKEFIFCLTVYILL